MLPPNSNTSGQTSSLVPGAVGVVRLFGVPVRFHFTFVILLIFLIVVGLSGRQSAAASALYVLALFASVLLHELGHTLVARRYDLKILEIVMLPIGGVARLERTPKPRQELWIALAGPAVNLALAAALFGVLAVKGWWTPVEKLAEPTDGNLLQRIATGNLVLAVFNLLPAFPMDGGRVLRSLLAFSRSEDQATRTAAGAGQLLAILMGLYGLLSMHFLLVFVAFFIYVGASMEAAAATGRVLTRGVPVRVAMIRDFRTLSHADTIRDAANLLLATSQQDFPVVHGGEVIGLLSRDLLLKAMAGSGPDSYVAGVMDRNFLRLDPEMDLAEALSLLSKPSACGLVMEDGRLLGLLTRENLAEFLLLRQSGMPVESSAAPPPA